MRIIEHFFPGQDLNLQSLRAIAKAIQEGTFAAPPVQQTDGLFINDLPSCRDEDSIENGEEQDVSELHEPLGSMMKDSRGNFRYVGAHSEIPFNAAVVTLGTQRKNLSIIPMPRVGEYPPTVSSQSSSVQPSYEIRLYLPPRDLCDVYISRFLEDIHCTYWLYPVETLLQKIDRTYTESSSSTLNSWTCSLYAMFAIGAASSVSQHQISPLHWPISVDQKTSEDYIFLAKQLIPTVYEEADIDSIRALAIMSIMMENLCSRVSAYLYMGASIQMAFSLGLHRDQLVENGSPMEHECNRRLWWTLFLLDQEISMRGGSPTIIDERFTKVTTAIPSEKILYPGQHTPLGWLDISVSLCRLKREITKSLYTNRSEDSISLSTISNSLLLLQKWNRQVPAHLRHEVPTLPTHKRAVAILHLHYWSTVILLTRPFLLYLVIKYKTLASNKKIWFERMGKICIEAAQKSATILHDMAAHRRTSSLTAFDSTCILRLIMIFILAYTHTRDWQYRNKIEKLIELCQRMEQIGFTKMVTEETPGRLADLGIPAQSPQSYQMSDSNASMQLDDEMIAQLWENWNPHFITPLQAQQSLNLTFDDVGAFDIDSETLAFTNLDESIVINYK